MQIRELRRSLRFVQTNKRDDYGIDVRHFFGGHSPEGVAYTFVRVDTAN